MPQLELYGGVMMDNKQVYLKGRICGRLLVLLVDSGDPLLYDICDSTMLPDELVTIIDKKKEKPFNLVYSNSTYTYIVMAAGRQERDDVGVVVDEMYKDENAIYVKGVLRQVATPTDGIKGDSISFPYVVIRIMKMDVPVVFK